MKINLSLIILLATVVACNSEKDKRNQNFINQNNSTETHNFDLNTKQKKVTEYKNTKYKDSFSIKKALVLSYVKSSKYPSSLNDTTACKTWVISKEDINKIFKLSKKMTGHEWHYLFDHLPCMYYGKVQYNGEEYKYTLNSGSWIRIQYKDSLLWYGCFEKECEKYFLSKVWNPDEEEE